MIFKIKSPVWRTVAGLVMVMLIAAAVVGLSYGLGRLVLDLCGSTDDFVGTAVLGFVAGVVCALAFGFIYVVGRECVKNPSLAFPVGLGVLVLGAAAMTGVFYGLGRLVAMVVPLFPGPYTFGDFMGHGVAGVIALSIVGMVGWAAYAAGKKYFDL